MEIQAAGNYHAGLLDTAGRAALGATCKGAGTGAGFGKLILDDLAAPAYITLANEVLADYGMLLIQSDKSSIDADDVELATITCADESIVADANVDYKVWKNGTLWASGTSPVTAGVVTLEFGTGTPGNYFVCILRQASTRKSGYVWVEAI